jgi:asparagine synthase (glutamine-hydrolysing)
MCGINGVYAYHDAASAPAEAELLATRDSMAARGPDGAGAWWSQDRRIGFGHRRLSIIDLSEGGTQPMHSADGRYTVVFNGEIYNYPELRARLEGEGVHFRSTSDTEVLLHLFARSGESMLTELRGMFALAIWDSLERRMVLARDPYGIKPLYYANDGWTFRFASQVKALLAGGNVSRDPEPAGIVGFHLWGHVPEPFSLYRDVRALPAGHVMVVDWLGPREPRAYATVAGTLAEGRERPSSGNVGGAIGTAVRDSVRAHLLADVEVGVFLSAGIDSGALLGLMADLGARPRAVTLTFAEFRGGPEDEAPLAAEVARQYGAEQIVRAVSEQEFRQDLPAILAAMDQPSVDGVNTWFVAKAAREAGLKVALSGLGGDELLGGYPSFRDLPAWRRRFGPLARIPGFGRAVRAVASRVIPGFARRQPKALSMFELAGSWEGAYILRRGLFMPSELGAMLEPDLVREGLHRLTPLGRLAATLRPDPGTDMGRVCALESSHYMRDQLLRDADWAGMAQSVEIRTPLVDAALLRDLAPVIPGLAPGQGKRALALAPSVPLPASVADRAKTGFVVPTAAWMAAEADRLDAPRDSATLHSKGLASRHWSRLVFAAPQLGGSPIAA